jgi:hypothetical protein
MMPTLSIQMAYFLINQIIVFMWLSGNHGLAEEDLKIWCVRKLPEG